LENGRTVDSETPNAYKFERFVFDVLPLAKKSLVVETDRSEEFAPIKNATGTDSPESSHFLQQQRARRWLEIRGISVPDSSVVEISPLSADSPHDLKEDILSEKIGDDEKVSF
jgi:UDP-N-acetylglucosamine/UDP-N-acetylgalactosamine diphosphorylase